MRRNICPMRSNITVGSQHCNQLGSGKQRPAPASTATARGPNPLAAVGRSILPGHLAFRRLQTNVLLLVVSTGSAVVSTFFVPSPWRFVEIGLAAVIDVVVLVQSGSLNDATESTTGAGQPQLSDGSDGVLVRPVARFEGTLSAARAARRPPSPATRPADRLRLRRQSIPS
jgi:hypothetical protein